MTDPIADLLTRIRNAQRAGLEQLELPASKMKQRICEVLREEGFVREVAARGDGKQGVLTVVLKYDTDKRPAISEIKRQSKPGLRRYVSYRDIPPVMNGLGIAFGGQQQRTCWRVPCATVLLPITQSRDRQVEGFGKFRLRHPEAPSQHLDA